MLLYDPCGRSYRTYGSHRAYWTKRTSGSNRSHGSYRPYRPYRSDRNGRTYSFWRKIQQYSRGSVACGSDTVADSGSNRPSGCAGDGNWKQQHYNGRGRNL